MAGGWSKDGAVQEQIDDSVNDAVRQARERLPAGKSAEHCDECGEAIPVARQQALPGVRFCIACQSEFDEQQKADQLFNRRGSKDSQLR